jgi:hypothetical protein
MAAIDRPFLSSTVQNRALSLFLIFAFTRLVILLISLVGSHSYQSYTREKAQDWPHEMSRLWGQFDVGWYGKLALEGYEELPYAPDQMRRWGFMPLYPLAVRAFMTPFGGKSFFGFGSFLSFTFTFLALYLLLHVFRERIANERNFLFLYLISAGSFYLSIPYTESLALLLLAATFYFTKEKHYILAALIAGLGVVTRIQLFALFIIPLIPLISGEEKWKVLKTFTMGFLFLIPLSAHIAYLGHLTGVPLAYFQIQEAWGNKDPYPLKALIAFFAHGFQHEPAQWLQFSIWSFYLALFIRNYKTIPLNELLFSLFVMVISTGTEQFYGTYRQVLLLIPAYIALSHEKEWLKTFFIYSNVILGTIYIIAFTDHQWFAV